MHKFAMPQAIVDRVVGRRGRAHVYDSIEPHRTALVVVDLQNAFMKASVAHALVEAAEHIVPNVNRLAETLRAAGGTVVWIRTVHNETSLREWSHCYDELNTPANKERRMAALTPGSEGHAFWETLAIAPNDLIVEKTRYSAFIQGSSTLEPQLRARGIDTVLITGCVTNVCCESTARDAMMLNFRTVMVSDGNAAATDEEHANSLIAFYLTFGDVQTTDEVIAHLRVTQAQPAVA